MKNTRSLIFKNVTFPNSDQISHCHVIQVENWHENAGPVIMDLLRDNNKLNSVKDNIQKDWHSTLCAQAAARRILDNLHLPTNK